MKLLWLGVGDGDFALNGTKALDEVLTKNGIKHTSHDQARLPARMAAVAAGPLGVRAAAVPGPDEQTLISVEARRRWRDFLRELGRFLSRDPNDQR